MGLQRKTCDHPGCNEMQCASDYNYRGKGVAMYRKYCQFHYEQRKANNAGFATILEYNHNLHPYLSLRKDYCENKDGSRGLGFSCTSTIVWSGQLDVDHIDENPSNNDPTNLQTLCKNCHAVKTNLFVKKHGRTPGRVTLKIIKSRAKAKPIINELLFEQCA